MPKLNQDQVNHVKCHTLPKKIEALSRSIPITKSQGSDGFGAHFYHTFKEDLLLKLSMLFHKIEPERTLHNTFYEATGTLIPKLQKGVTSKQIY